MKGADGSSGWTAAGREEGGEERMASRCIINCSEISSSVGANCPSIRSPVVPAAALILYFCSGFFLNREA